MSCLAGGDMCKDHGGAHRQCYAHERCISACWPEMETSELATLRAESERLTIALKAMVYFHKGKERWVCDHRGDEDVSWIIGDLLDKHKSEKAQ